LIIDINAFLGVWPFRKLNYSGVEGLDYLMKRADIELALVSPFESIFYMDNDSANSFYCEIENSRTMVPITAINPLLPDIQRYLKDLAGLHRLRGLKLHPDYHGYRLGEDSARQVFKMAEDLDLPVIVPLRIYDERSHHRLVKVPPTDVKELVEAARLYPGVRIIACNGRTDEIRNILKHSTNLENLYAAISWAQEEGFIASTVKTYGYDRLMWGSNMPLQYPEPVLEQVRKADIGTEEQKKILAGNARTIFDLSLWSS
jgi:predicted TIM-barrel fold metal-dependent hydrolase